MKKIIFSAFALFLMVSFSSCRETKEEKMEETVEDIRVEEVTEQPATIDTSTTVKARIVIDSTENNK
jgi:hypothetical protein